MFSVMEWACGIMGGAMSERSPIWWPDHVLTKASVNMILTVRLEGIKSFDEIAYWETILSVSCPPRTVVQGNVANFSRARKLGLYVKRCGLRISVWDPQRNSRSIEICTSIPIDIRWWNLRMWKCIVPRGIPYTPSPRLTFIGFESIQCQVAALVFIATRARRNLGMLQSKLPRHCPPS